MDEGMRKDEKIIYETSRMESPVSTDSTGDGHKITKRYQTRMTRKEGFQNTADVSCSYQDPTSTHEKFPLSKSSKVETTGKHETVVHSGEWRQVMTTTVNSENDLLLELNTFSSQPDSQNIPMIELVVAVQSAIKQRQGIIDEWKKRAEDLSFQLQDLTNEKRYVERTCMEKQNKIDHLQKTLKDLTGQYGDLSSQTDDIFGDLSTYRVECDRLKSVYQCAMHELTEAKNKLIDYEENKSRLERKLRYQEESNQKLELQLRTLEPELNQSKESLRTLQERINRAESELLLLKNSSQQTEGDSQHVSLNAYHEVLQKLQDSMKMFERERQKGFSIQDDLQKFSQLIESLSDEKGALCNLLKNLETEKKSLFDRNILLESQLIQAQNQVSRLRYTGSEMETDIKCLSSKLDQVLELNKDLEKELNQNQNNIRNLRRDLQESAMEKNSLNLTLNSVNSELDRQKLLVTETEITIKSLKNEKSLLDNKLKSHEELERKRLLELNRISVENDTYKSENLELHSKCEKLAHDVRMVEEDAKRLHKEVEEKILQMEEMKRNFQDRIDSLQNHHFAKEEDWKSNLYQEMTKLNENHQKELRKYYDDMLSKKVSEVEHKGIDSHVELASANKYLEVEVNKLKKALENSHLQLQETILSAEEDRREMMSRASEEQSRLMEQLNLTKSNAAKISAEIEAQIQRLTQKTFEDSTTISLLTAENKRLSGMVEKNLRVDEEWEQTRTELISERESLKADLGHCRNLLSFTESTCDRLRIEMSDLKKNMEDYGEMKDSLHKEVVSLQKLIGQKESQLEINMATLQQTRQQLIRYKEENCELKCQLSAAKLHSESVEDNLRTLTEQIQALNATLSEVNQEKRDMAQKREALNHEINILKGQLSHLTQDSTMLYEKSQFSERCLDDLQISHSDLKKRLHSTESALVQAQTECKEISSRYQREADIALHTGQQLARLQSDHLHLEKVTKEKINDLENVIRMLRDEIELNRESMCKAELKLECLKNCLSYTESAYMESARTFSDLWENILGCFRHQAVFRDSEEGASDPHFDSLTFPKPMSSNHTECSEMCHRINDVNNWINSDSKLNRLRDIIKDFAERKRLLERCDLMKDNEIKQLNAAISALKDEYQKQFNCLNSKLNEKTRNLELAECQLLETKMMLTSKEEYLKNVSAASMNSLQHIQNLECIIAKLQDEKAHFLTDVEFMSQKLSELESQNLTLTSKLRESECKLSKIQIRNVSLEGDIENLKLNLQTALSQQNDASDSLLRNSIQRQELAQKITTLQSELENTSEALNELKTQHDHIILSKSDESNVCDGKGNCCLKSRCHHLHSCLSDFELERKLLCERLEASQFAEHDARLIIVGLEETIKSLKHQLEIGEIERASLEGRLSQLQKVVFSDPPDNQYGRASPVSQKCHDISSTKRYESESAFLKENLKKLQINISVFEAEKEALEKVVNQLKNENETLNKSICRAKEQKLMVEKELESFRHKCCELQRMLVQREQEVEHMRKTLEILKCQIKTQSASSPIVSKVQDVPFREYMSDAQSSKGPSTYSTNSRVSTGVISCSTRIACHKDRPASVSPLQQSSSSIIPGKNILYDKYHNSTYVTTMVPPHATQSFIENPQTASTLSMSSSSASHRIISRFPNPVTYCNKFSASSPDASQVQKEIQSSGESKRMQSNIYAENEKNVEKQISKSPSELSESQNKEKYDKDIIETLEKDFQDENQSRSSSGSLSVNSEKGSSNLPIFTSHDAEIQSDRQVSHFSPKNKSPQQSQSPSRSPFRSNLYRPVRRSSSNSSNESIQSDISIDSKSSESSSRSVNSSSSKTPSQTIKFEAEVVNITSTRSPMKVSPLSSSKSSSRSSSASSLSSRHSNDSASSNRDSPSWTVFSAETQDKKEPLSRRNSSQSSNSSLNSSVIHSPICSSTLSKSSSSSSSLSSSRSPLTSSGIDSEKDAAHLESLSQRSESQSPDHYNSNSSISSTDSTHAPVRKSSKFSRSSSEERSFDSSGPPSTFV